MRTCSNLFSRLFYKLFIRSCIFNDIKSDRMILFGVAILDSGKLRGFPVTMYSPD